MSFRRFILLLFVPTALLTILLSFDLLPILRGGFGWQWNYMPVPLKNFLTLLFAISIYGIGAWWLITRTRRPIWSLLWTGIGVMTISAVVILIRDAHLFEQLVARTTSVVASGFYQAGVQIGTDGEAWSNWSAFTHSPTWNGGHVSVAPPGLPLLYAASSSIIDTIPNLAKTLARPISAVQCTNWELLTNTPGEWAAAWIGVLMPLWAALAAIPLYFISRQITALRPVARETVLLLPVIPALTLFAGNWSTFYPFLSLLIFALLMIALQRRQPILLLAAGLIAGIGMFLNYAFLPLLGMIGIFTMFYITFIERPPSLVIGIQRLIGVGLVLGIGFLIPWGTYWLASGETLIDLLRATLDVHLDIDRPYLPWVFLHYWDWTLLNGFVLSLVWYGGIIVWARRRENTFPVLPLALLVTMIVLTVSGTARGESGRVWLLYTPFILLAAMDGLTRIARSDAERTRGWLMMLGTSAALMVVLAATLPVLQINDAPPKPIPPTSSISLNTITGSFSGTHDTLHLTGWQGTLNQEDILFDLAWTVTETPLHPYWFSILLVSPNGTIHDGGIWQPGSATPNPANSESVDRGTYPATCWSPNMVIRDQIRLPLPETTRGEWWVSLSVYGDPVLPEGRLETHLPDGSADTQIGLGPILIG